jgi:hypothetical protein
MWFIIRIVVWNSSWNRRSLQKVDRQGTPEDCRRQHDRRSMAPQTRADLTRHYHVVDLVDWPVADPRVQLASSHRQLVLDASLLHTLFLLNTLTSVCLPSGSFLKMEVILSPETSVSIHKSKRRQNPEDQRRHLTAVTVSNLTSPTGFPTKILYSFFISPPSLRAQPIIASDISLPWQHRATRISQDVPRCVTF